MCIHLNLMIFTKIIRGFISVERLTGDNPEYAIPQKVTISIGAVVTQGNALNPNEIYRLADNALYEAKETGRNKVVVRDVVNFCESP